MPVNTASAHSYLHDLPDLHLVAVVPNLRGTVELRLALGTGEPAKRTTPAAPGCQKERPHVLTMNQPDESSAVVPWSRAALHTHSHLQLWKCGAQAGCRLLEVIVIRTSHITRFGTHLVASLVAPIQVGVQEVPERRPIDWGTVPRMRPKNALREGVLE